MAFVPWTDAMLLGIAKIDEQHRWLVNCINELHDELARPAPDRGIVGDILDGLLGYAMNHFLVEEELFQQHGYPQREAHHAAHNRFTARLFMLLEAHQSGTDVGADTLALLKEWITHHVMVEDKAFAPFLKSKGVE